MRISFRLKPQRVKLGKVTAKRKAPAKDADGEQLEPKHKFSTKVA